MGRKQVVAERFDAREAELHEISTWMYENPEPAYQEWESGDKLWIKLGAAG